MSNHKFIKNAPQMPKIAANTRFRHKNLCKIRKAEASDNFFDFSALFLQKIPPLLHTYYNWHPL